MNTMIYYLSEVNPVTIGLIKIEGQFSSAIFIQNDTITGYLSSFCKKMKFTAGFTGLL